MDAVVSVGKLQWRFTMETVPRVYERMWLPAVGADGAGIDLLVQVGYVCWDFRDNLVELDCVLIDTDSVGQPVLNSVGILDGLSAANVGA